MSSYRDRGGGDRFGAGPSPLRTRFEGSLGLLPPQILKKLGRLRQRFVRFESNLTGNEATKSEGKNNNSGTFSNSKSIFM